MPFLDCYSDELGEIESRMRSTLVMLNKSLVTNLVALGIVFAGYLSPWHQQFFLNAGYFALSGAVTNWLAIHMLFEKVPGFYGSGVIPSKFEEFKSGIRNLIMQQFFTKENVEKFFSEQQSKGKINIEPLLKVLDLDRLFAELVDTIKQSSFGPMLEMFGGAKVLDPIKGPFEEKFISFLEKILTDPAVIQAVSNMFSEMSRSEETIDKVNAIVQKRLDDLTPDMVKQIIQDMIREHLGWLVVWGGVFGGMIGILATFLK